MSWMQEAKTLKSTDLRAILGVRDRFLLGNNHLHYPNLMLLFYSVKEGNAQIH